MTELHQQFDGLQNIFSEFPGILEKFNRKWRNWQFQSVMLFKQTQLINTFSAKNRTSKELL